MRKLLLSSTALAAAATLSANAALADVSISGYYEWRYESRSSLDTASDGTKFANDSEVKILFTNKTDSGLDISMKMELETDAGNSAVQENALYISGAFGKFILGGDDGVNDILPPAPNDLISEEMFYTSKDGTADADHFLGIKNGDMANLAGNDSKITYMLPAMGGLSAGISHTNKSAAGNADTTEFGAAYSMDAGGAAITIGAVSGTTEATTQDIDSQQIGIKISTGSATVVLAQSEYEASGDDEQGTSAGISFKVSDSMTVGAFTSEVEDDLSAEEYTNTGAEIQYTIASGLKAIINVEDYDYKTGTSGGFSDNGTASKLTIKASF